MNNSTPYYQLEDYLKAIAEAIKELKEVVANMSASGTNTQNSTGGNNGDNVEIEIEDPQ